MEQVQGVKLQALKKLELQKEVQFKAKHDNKESDDKGMRKSTKWMVGATILVAVTAIGVITHNKIKASKAMKELLNDVTHQKGHISSVFDGTGCEEAVAARLAEIEKLPITEQAEQLANLDKIHDNIFLMQRAKNYGCTEYLRRGMKEYPEEVKKAINEGRWFDAGELYEKYVQTLPNTYRAKSTGKTVEETIANVFGKDSKVKPHTYDLSQEGEYIISQRNFGGFAETLASREGVLYEPVDDAAGNILYNSINDTASFLTHYTRIPIEGGYSLSHGCQDGRYITILTAPSPVTDTMGNAITLRLGFISKGRSMSPAQKDLLFLSEHPEKLDAFFLDKLTERCSVRDSAGNAGIVNLDYDLAYSIIQSMARG